MTHLLIIDALALAYRSFHAIRYGLTTRAGVPTNALLGFVRTFENLRELWQPEHALVVFDGGAPQHRLELTPEYKAQRKPMPPELKVQLDSIREYLDMAGVRHVRMERQEADDVMASVARQATGVGERTLIATSDKDLFQVVDEHIGLLTGFDAEVLGPEKVEMKTGVRPEQIVDWLALIGDAADNFRGLPGVGRKTAADWLRTYGSIEGILEHVDELAPARLRTVVSQHVQLLERNRQMVRLDTTLDCGVGIKALKLEPVPAGPLLTFFERYDMKSQARKYTQGELF